MLHYQVGPMYHDVQQRGDSSGTHTLEGCFAKPGRMEGGQQGKLQGAEQELCSLEVQGVATCGYFLERHHIITMSKGGDLAYGSIMMDLISCFKDIVDSKHSAESNGTLQMVWVFSGKLGFFIRIESKGKYFSLVVTCTSSINNCLKKCLKERKWEGKQHTLFDILLNFLGLVNCFGFNSSD